MCPTFASIQLCQSGKSGWLFTIDYGKGQAQFFKTDDNGEGLWMLLEGQWSQTRSVVDFNLPNDPQKARVRIYETLVEDHVRWVRIRMNKISFFQTLDLLKKWREPKSTAGIIRRCIAECWLRECGTNEKGI